MANTRSRFLSFRSWKAWAKKEQSRQDQKFLYSLCPAQVERLLCQTRMMGHDVACVFRVAVSHETTRKWAGVRAEMAKLLRGSSLCNIGLAWSKRSSFWLFFFTLSTPFFWQGFILLSRLSLILWQFLSQTCWDYRHKPPTHKELSFGYHLSGLQRRVAGQG